MLDGCCCGVTPKHIDLPASDACNIKSSEGATIFLDQEKIQGSRGSNRENYKASTFSRGSSSYELRSGFELETFAFVGTIQWYVRRVGRYIVAGMEQPGRPEYLQFLRIKNQAHQDVYKFKF